MKYYYISTKRTDGKPILYGALRNRGANGEIGAGTYCSNENEARKAVDDVLRGKQYELFISKHRVLSEANKEFKGKTLRVTGDLDYSTQRVSHKVEERPKIIQTNEL